MHNPSDIPDPSTTEETRDVMLTISVLADVCRSNSSVCMIHHALALLISPSKTGNIKD
jgi:hypothetical protein